MANRAFSIASLVSAVLLGCTALLWLSAFVLDPWSNRLSVTGDFHIAVWGGCDGPPLGRLVFFNDKRYGPYRGSIISVSGYKEPAEVRCWGDAFGVYYRYFRWSGSGATLWTLMISLAYPLAMFSFLPAGWLWVRWRRSRALPTRRSRSAELPLGGSGQ
jgi:hypothetical protein